jgi:hypothetical protein
MPVPPEEPIVVAPSPTPFRVDDAVDYGAIERKNVGRWLNTRLSGFVLNSENGEEAFFAEHERLAVLRTVQRAATAQKRINAGVDSPSVSSYFSRSNVTRICSLPGVDVNSVGRSFPAGAKQSLRDFSPSS